MVKPALNLTGEDGNPILIVVRAQKALRKTGADEEYIAEFTKDATSGDYEHLLEVVFRYFEVDGE